MAAPSPTASAPAAPSAMRAFGRFRLLRLLGKSERTMAWLVADPASGQDWMLVLPRVQPAGASAQQRWQTTMRQAARLNHPRLAAVLESGLQDGWPYAAYDPRDSATLADRASPKGQPGLELAAWAGQALQGLAFAHQAGVAHQDLQSFLVLISDTGQVRLAGLGVAIENHPAAEASAALRLQRGAAERDVLALGVLMHAALCGQPALDEPDTGRVIARLPPLGREFVRLPWSTPHPVAEPLRAIINRATDRQERQRYRNARTLLGALEGWQSVESNADSGVLALLADRLRSVGVLPSSPGSAARSSRLATMERERNNELADVVLEDLALSFELLRQVNAPQARGAQAAGAAPVLTVRRAIALVGLDGVRRATVALRVWPGPLGDEHSPGAQELLRQMDRCKLAGRVAQALRPSGYDAEVVHLVALLQNLGRLVVHYHFAEEAVQIRRLMQPAPAARAGEPEDPGMTEEGASFAVLGADIEAIGAAVARHWGWDDSVLAMIRRQSPTAAVHGLEQDHDILRAVASCANEAVDALAEPAPRVAAALARVVTRYGRGLNFGLRELQAALQDKPLDAEAKAEKR